MDSLSLAIYGVPLCRVRIQRRRGTERGKRKKGVLAMYCPGAGRHLLRPFLNSTAAIYPCLTLGAQTLTLSLWTTSYDLV
ncbi:hypothetical protein CI238_08146 [Colletotrichum incanum]|uniref:Uncharacterized protein n=1 Tax=Colletotrichum incanum TaxID=1573173 RepID=A0A167EJY8_COLIC|nr:hypothetical protein CI238_08146 [Colletotrichum incanum]